ATWAVSSHRPISSKAKPIRQRIALGGVLLAPEVGVQLIAGVRRGGHIGGTTDTTADQFAGGCQFDRRDRYPSA
ncbi:MAG TPA: hypothetical protein DIC52_06800, partial [Candidatus Latescibacteria bacterium]|nr:hypothetical protein [Candidatus Latescibacterota bacterium]